MSLGCININSQEFAKLKEATKLNEYLLSAKIKSWQDRNNRELDEFPTADELEITTSKAPLTEVKKGVSELFESNPELAEIGTEKQYSEYLDSTVDNPSKVLTFSTQRKIDDEKGLNKLLNLKDTTIRGAGEVTRGDKKEIRVYDENIKYGDKSRPFGFNTDSEINNYLVVVNTKNKRTYTSSSSNLENSAEILNKYNIPLEATEDILILNELREELKKALASKSTAVKETHSKKRQDLQQYKEEVFKKFKEITPQNVNIILNEIGVVKELKTYYLIKSPKDILVLGSKQDIQGFKEFIGQAPDIAFSKTKDSIENKLKIFFNQFGFQYKEGDSSTDLLNKIIYTNKNDSSVFINNSVKALGQLVLANTNVDFHKVEALIEDTPEFKKLLSDSSDYIKKTHKFLKDGNRIPMEEWISYIKEYNKIKNQVLGKYVKESLLDKNNSTKLHKVINDFIQWFKDLFNNAKSLKEITDNLVQQVLLNQKEIIINSKDLKNREQVTLNKALEETAHGKDIIKTFGEFGLILTGSISASEQGTVFRKTGKLLHDIDWVVPKGFNKDFNKKLKDTFKGSALVREFDSPGYYTQTYIVPPKGHTISNLTFFKPEIHGKTKYIASYDVLDKNGNVVSNYRRYYDVKPSGKVVENREVYNEGLKNVDKDLEAVSVDFFQNKEDMKYMPYTVDVEGVKLQLSNWLSSFTEKLKYGRAKDLLDYAAFIPNDRIKSESKVGQPIKVFRTSRAKDGQKEYDLDKKPKGKSTETELIIDPTRTLDITQAQESGIANNDMLVYEQILREAKYEYDYLTSETFKKLPNKSYEENIGIIVAKKALEKGYEGIIKYKDPYASNIQAIRDKGRTYTKFGSVNPNQIDLDDAKEWLESRGIPFDMSEQTIEIAKGMPYGTEGLFSEGVIYLSQYATKGTEYHEAFHAVFRMFLTDQQQDAILAESKKQQPVTQQELDELEEAGYFKIGDDGKIYKNIDLNAKGEAVPTIMSKEELERLILEERLAEQFRSYVTSNQKVKSSNSKIQNFLDKLLKFIKYYFSNKMTIDRLFHNIETGTINKKNLNKRYVSKGSAASFSRNNSLMNKAFKGIDNIDNIVSAINSKFLDQFKKAEESGTSDNFDPSKEYQKIKESIKIHHLFIDKADKGQFDEDTGLPITFSEYFETEEEAVSDINNHIKNIKEFLNDKGELIDKDGLENYFTNENLDWFNEGSIEMMKSIIFWNDAKAEYGNVIDRGILYRAKNSLSDYGFKVYGDVMVQDEDVDEDVYIYEKSHLEENRKDTLSKEIKQFFTFIPKLDENNQPVINIFGTYDYLKFNDAYNEALTTVINAKNFNELNEEAIVDLKKNGNNQTSMLQMLHEKGKLFPEIKFVANALQAKYDEAKQTGDFSFIAKFYSSMALGYTDFVGAIEEINYVEENNKLVKELTIRYFDVNTNKAEKILAKNWETNAKRQDGKGLYVRSSDGSYEYNTDLVSIIETASEYINQFDTRSSIVDDVAIKNMHDLMTAIGIDIPIDKLRLLFENGAVIDNNKLKGRRLYAFLMGKSTFNKNNIETTRAILDKSIYESKNGSFVDFYDNYGTEIIKNRFAKIGGYLEKASLKAFTNGENKQIWPINMHTTFGRVVDAFKNFNPNQKESSFWNDWVKNFRLDPFYSPSTASLESLLSLSQDEVKNNSIFIHAILNSKQFRETLSPKTFDVIKKKHETVAKNTFSNMSPKLSLIHRINSFGNNGAKKEMTIILPTLSDRGRMLELVVPRISIFKSLHQSNVYTNVEIYSKEKNEYPIMMGYVIQDLLSAKRIKNTKTNIKNYSENVNKFRQLTFLNKIPAAQKLMKYVLEEDQSYTDPDEITKLFDEVKIEIANYIENQIKSKTESYRKLIVSKKSTMIGSKTLNLYEEILKVEENKESVTKDEVINAIIRDYVVQDIISKNEMRKLFGGDPALYKNTAKDPDMLSVVENFNKRFGGIATPGLETYIEEEPGGYGDTPTYTTGIINDIFREDPKNLEMLEKISGKSAVAAYKDGSNVTDAMGLTTLAKYRKTAMGMGKWSMLKGGHEEAWKNYNKKGPNNGKFINNKGKAIKLVPLKTYHDGLYLKDIDGVPTMIRILIKHSTVPLLKEFTKTSPTFDAIRKHMEGPNGFDELNMDSGVKSGLHNNITLEFKDGVPTNLNKIIPIELRTEFKRSPQLIPENARESNLASQIMKLIQTGVKNNASKEYNLNSNSSTEPIVLTGQEVYDKYNEIIGAQLDMGMRNTFESIGVPIKDDGYPDFSKLKEGEESLETLQKLRSILQNSIEERDLPDNYIKSLNIIKTETGYDFETPPAMPVFSKMFERMFLSKCKNGFMKIPIYGKGLVQIAELGEVVYTDKAIVGDKRPLKFIQGTHLEVPAKDIKKVGKEFDEEGKPLSYYENIVSYTVDGELQYFTKSGKKGSKVIIQQIKHAEIAIPFELAESMKLPKNPDGSFDLSNIPSDVLELLGYRIPTQGKNSILPLKIAHVLPKSMSKQIMVPAEITTQMGSDFDVDKLFTIMPHLEVTATYSKKDKDGKIVNVEWNEFGGFKGQLNKYLPKDVKINDIDVGKLMRNTDYSDEMTVFSREQRSDIKSATIKAKNKQQKLKENLRNISVKKVGYDLNNIKNADKRSLDNAMFDIMQSILLSPYHTTEVLSTIDSPLIPNLGNLMKVLKSEYKDYVDMQDADAESILEYRNKAGKTGVGIWATATTGHAGRQNIPGSELTIGFLFDGKEYTDISIIEDTAGHDISYQIQQHLTSAVDNANTPSMEFLNDNTVTATVRNLIISLGFNSEELNGKNIKKTLKSKGVDVSEFDNQFWSEIDGSSITVASFFLNQPIINLLVERFINEEANPGQLNSIAYNIITEKFRNVADLLEDGEDAMYNIDPNELLEDFNKDLTNMDEAFASRQVKVLINFLALNSIGIEVNALNKVLNSDRIKEFTSLSGIEKHLEVVESVTTNPLFKGVADGENLLEGFPIAEEYIKMIRIAEEFTGNFIPFNELGMQNAKSNIQEALAKTNLNRDTLELINQSSYMHIVSQKNSLVYPESPFAALFSKEWESALLTGPNNISVQWRQLMDAIENSQPDDPIRSLIEEGTIENAFFATIADHEDNSKLVPIEKKDKKSKKPTGKTGTINIYAGTNENTELSNFAERTYTDPLGIEFRNVEAGFQYAKLSRATPTTAADLAINDKIAMDLQSATGAQAKALGRKIKGLNVKAWDQASESIMKGTIKDSFEQNPQALKKLLATGNATLTHTQDKGKWGKLFPKILMEVRKELGTDTAIKFKDKFKHKILSYNRSITPDQNRQSDGFSALLSHKDPRVVKFATNLIYYQILSQGFSKGPNSMADIIPIEVWNTEEFSLNKENPQSFNEYIRNNIYEFFKDSEFWNYTGFTNQFLLHNSAVARLIPSPSIKNSLRWMSSINKNGKYIADESDPIARNGEFPKMVKVYNANTKEYVLLYRMPNSSTTTAEYALYKATEGAVNETYKFQNFNISRSLDNAQLTPEQFEDLQDKKQCKL